MHYIIQTDSWRESEEVASSEIEWLVGGVRGKQTLFGENVLTPRNRDYGALFFNLDRTRSLYITLVTTFFFSADFGGVIGFGGVSGIPPLVVGTPQWKIYAPE